MKVKASVKPICADCKVVRRKGVVRIVCKKILNTIKDKANRR